LGVEAKEFLLKGNIVWRLLNLFYFNTSPFKEEFMKEPLMDF